jgi:hypothetical protein
MNLEKLLNHLFVLLTALPPSFSANKPVVLLSLRRLMVKWLQHEVEAADFAKFSFEVLALHQLSQEAIPTAQLMGGQ